MKLAVRLRWRRPAVRILAVAVVLGSAATVGWNCARAEAVLGYVSSVAISPDASTVATAHSDTTVRIWDLRTGRVRQLLSACTPNIRDVTSVAFSPTGTVLAAGCLDGTVRVWDTKAFSEVGTLRGHTFVLTAIAFSPNGSKIATCGSSGGGRSLALLNLSSGATRVVDSSPGKYVMSVAFSPDGAILAAGSQDAIISLWDVKSRSRRGTLSEHTGSVNTIAFSPNGQTLASGSSDGTVKLWDVDRGKTYRTLTGHSEEVAAVAFSADGGLLASGGGSSVIVWNLSSNKQEGRFRVGRGRVTSVAISSDGAYLNSSTKMR